MPGVVITIDGPAGAGKSTVARELAKEIGFDFLDTGALYRCVTLAVLRANLDSRDEPAVEALAHSLTIELNGEMVLLNGHDVSREIRSPEVSSSIGSIADNLGVRRLLTQWQRDWTGGKCVVTEGRDQGSEVFPDSPCKIFLSASDDERARRRLNELLERGIQADFATILEQQNRRDCEDRTRPVGTLRRADDAVDICTDGLLLEEVIQAIKRVIAERIGRLSADSSTSEVQRHLASKEGRPT